MDTVSYDDLEQIARLLEITFTGDTNSVKQATAILKKLGQEAVPFTQSLLNIIKVNKYDAPTEKIKSSACVTLTHSVTDALKNGKLNSEQRVYLIRTMVETLCSETVGLNLKVSLQYILVFLFTFEKDNPIILEVMGVVEDRLKSNEAEKYTAGLLLLQGLVNIPLMEQQKLAEWFVGLSDILINVGGGLLQGIILGLQEAAGLAENPNEQLAKVTACYSGTKVLVLWVKTIQEFVKYLGQNNPKMGTTSVYLKHVATNEKIVTILTGCLGVNYQATERQHKDNIISTTGVKDLDAMLNVLKTNSLRIFNKFMDPMTLIEFCAQLGSLTDNLFIVHSQEVVIRAILKSLIIYLTSETTIIEDIFKTQDISDLLIECLSFASKLTIHPNLNNLFSDVTKNLVVDVCFALIKTNEAEQNNFTSNPSQFVLSSVDICGGKSSPIVPTHAARFLLELCRSVDGVLSYVAKLLFHTIDYTLVSNSVETIDENYKLLVDHKNSFFLSKVDATLRVESCVLILGVLNSLVAQRKDLLNDFENLLKTYKEFFLDQAHAIIKARICLIFPVYAHVLFRDEGKQDMYALLLRFMLDAAGSDNETLNSQANDSLYSLFEKEHLIPIIAPYITDLLKGLAMYVPTTRSIKIMDTIYEIITSFENQIVKEPDLLLGLLEILIKRGIEEYEKIRLDPEKKKIMLNKIWNVIRGIGDQRQYVTLYQTEIEKLLEPMFNYLETNEDVDFDEDILNYINSATQITKKVSPAIWKVFLNFPKIFERYEGVLGHLFPALNQLILHGHEEINKSPETIETLVNMGIQSLNPSRSNADCANVSEGALFLQLILQYIEPIPPELIQNILKATYEKFIVNKVTFLRPRFAGVFLCAFLKNFEITQEILHNFGILPSLMDLFLKEILIFEENTYDRKLLIIGLSHFLAQTKLYLEIESRFVEIFDVVISVLRYVRYMDQINTRKAGNGIEEDDEDEEFEETDTITKKNILMTFLDIKDKMSTGIQDFGKKDEDEEEKVNDADDEAEEGEVPDVDEGEEGENMEKKEALSTVKTFETELKSKDEFICFRDAVLVLKDQKIEFIRQVVDTLPDKKKEFLKDVLQSYRITIGPEGGVGQARKIVRPSAKKVANIQHTNGTFQKM